MRNIFLFIIILSSLNFAQELNCTVIVNYENVAVNYRELLADFSNQIENYMNTTQFTNEPWEGQKIDCTLNIFFLSASDEVNYAAQVVLVSTRPVYKSTRQSPILTINDPNWTFKYEKGQAMYANQSTFDALTGFLDYYANIIIGFDWDTWEEFGGSPYFKKAYDIVNLGATSGFKSGWERSSSSYNRYGFVEDILNDKFRPFREAFYVYHYGVDIYSQNKELGQEKIAYLINALDEMKSKMDINSVLIRTFFDAKSGEIVELMKDYADREIFVKLKRIDPSHAAKYDEFLY